MDFNEKAAIEFDFLTKDFRPVDPGSKISMYTMGIPASGKTSSAKNILEEMSIPQNAIVFLDPDDVMTRLSGYKDSLVGDDLKR